MSRRHLWFFLMLLLSSGWMTWSNVHAEIVEGKDYTVLSKPQSTQNSQKIEVLEFFWYGCPHCDSLHPHLKSWLKSLPDDVSFTYVPATLRPNWATGAKIFYTLQAAGMLDALHDKAYDAIHRGKIDLNNESVLFDWIEKQGVDRKKFENTYQSFGVQNQVARSSQLTRQYQLNGVPALVIDGKYLTSGRMGGTPQDTIKTLNELLEKVRKERAAN